MIPLDPSISALERRIEQRAQLLGLTLSAEVRGQLATYLSLLFRWNRRINLVAFKDPDNAIDRLIGEPLLAAQWIPGDVKSLIDIGSGGGSPAIPLKLVLPHVALVMVESRVRKASFLREAVRDLGLKDARVERERFEALKESRDIAGHMDVVTVRAVRVGASELQALEALLRPGGFLLWFRGRHEGGEMTPGLASVVDQPLVPALGSRLRVLRKLER
ncbi:MAG: 16S rRNA (guanine(527)-N(7))-methyltransferase RsmG [Vicinamibacteraceae bacterium]